MLSLIPLPYRILGALLIVLALFAAGFGYGVKVTKGRHAAEQIAAERLATLKYRAEVERGNDLSARLAAAEAITHEKTIERIKHVKNVTTGRDCLSADAVSLLNSSGKLTLRETARQPPAENAGAPAATDTDVEAWAIEASGQYETCAWRINALIDFEVGRP